MPRNSEPTAIEREALVENGRRKQAEREQLLAPYETLPTKGVVLVDGNHCYLEAVKAFQLFNESYDKHGFEELKSKVILNPYQEIKGKHLAGHVVHTFDKLADQLGYWVARGLVGADKDIVSRNTILYGGDKLDPNKTILLDVDIETFIFDARLPTDSETIRCLESEWNAAKKLGQDNKREGIGSWLDLIKDGMWCTYHESGHLIVRYALKDEFLDALTQSDFTDEEMADRGDPIWDVPLNCDGKTQLVCGEKILYVSARGEVFQREKGVDTLFVIKGCEIAARSDVDFVCIVTNDTDYEPLIEHIKSKGKDVYLYSSGDPKRISKPLIGTVGWNNCITLKELVSDFDSSGHNEAFSKGTGIWKDAENNPAFLMIGADLLGKHRLEAIKKQRGNE